jgi:hypothetical protein
MTSSGRQASWWLVTAVLLAVVVLFAALDLARDDAPGPDSADGSDSSALPASSNGSFPSGSTRATGPTGAKCMGVPISTSDDPHAVLRRHPPGTTYCLSEGVHRIDEPLAPEDGDALVGDRGAVLSGSKLLTGWSRVENGWRAKAFLPRDPETDGECLPRAPLCAQTEDVFLDGRRLRRVRSAAMLRPGTFFASYGDNEVTLGSDPRDRVVEQAVASSLISSSGDRVTVRNLVLEKAANEAQKAAVESRQAYPQSSVGWLVEHNVIRQNHGVGVGVGDRGIVSGNVIRRQGQLGVAAWGDDVRIRDNTIVRNGTAGYHPDWEAGGVKAWKTDDAVLSGNRLHGNRGPGLWSDGGCDGTVYIGNVITDNWGAGIQHELSYDARITDNQIVGNGLRHKGWLWEAGIQIQSSGGNQLIEIAYNVVSGNANGVAVLESGNRTMEEPAPAGPHIVRNLLVHHNDITMHAGQSTGVVQDISDHAVFSRGIRFRNNTYRVDAPGHSHFAWADQHLTWSEWLGPGVGQDRGSVLLWLDD